MQKKRIAVVGASGYSGEELLRILFKHENCEVRIVTSRQNAGKKISDFFPRFSAVNLEFSNPDIEQIAKNADFAFLALPHGLAAEFAEPLINKKITVIDLSADFRIKNPEIYKKYYGESHTAPSLLDKSTYGLPELNRELIRNSKLIACPGCYPTSILLPLCPLLKEKAIKTNNIIVASMSGVTGAGRKVELPYIFPECNESIRAYSPSGHRHLPEIEQELAKFAGISEIKINFIPHLVPLNRGINSTITVELQENISKENISDIYSQYYKYDCFIRILPYGKMADTKYVTMSNVCEIGHIYDERTGKLIITSAIDNLTKGAAGQAVQCFNIISGFDEKTGLI